MLRGKIRKIKLIKIDMTTNFLAYSKGFMANSDQKLQSEFVKVLKIIDRSNFSILVTPTSYFIMDCGSVQ